MIRKLLLSALVVSVVSCEEIEDKKVAAQPGSLTSIEWVEPAKNLGKIIAGQNLEINYHFKNTGTKPLIIKSVTPGCGCTVAKYPMEPIAPGMEADIKASFDSKGREGHQHKEIKVIANTEGKEDHTLSFELDVVKQ